MRYLVLGLVLVLGCSDSTGPTPDPDALVIRGGNFQQAVVTQEYANPLRVEATLGLQAVSGQRIFFAPVTEGAGEAFIPYVTTGEDGIAETPWTAGTVAGEHLVEARAMVDGSPIVVAQYVLEALPGPAAASIIEEPDGWSAIFFPRTADTVAVYAHTLFTDVFLNPIAFTVEAGEFLARVDEPGWTSAARSVRATRELVEGDTTTVRFIREDNGELLVDAVAEVLPTQVTHEGERIDTWMLRTVVRDRFRPSVP